jgi:hypothetical protein
VTALTFALMVFRHSVERSEFRSKNDVVTVTIDLMSLATFKIGKKEFVVVPRKRFDQLTRAEQDQKDAEIARKGREVFLRGNVKPIPLADARRKWGV